MPDYSYIGSELELFRKARNWKSYTRQLLRKYLGNEVLEVGAGIGATTEILCTPDQKRWICLEPDPEMGKTLTHSIDSGYLPSSCKAAVGTLSDLNPQDRFDSVIYIDVLEHIENDKAEVELASNFLSKNGFLIILAPAHQWLYTPFDEAIGHYRRYNKAMLSAVIPRNLECVSLKYLDCVGLLASLGNRLLLKSSMPSEKQILLWDRAMVPLSRKIDPLIHYAIGKTILGIWKKK